MEAPFRTCSGSVNGGGRIPFVNLTHALSPPMLLAASRSGCYDQVMNEQSPAPGLGLAIETAIDAIAKAGRFDLAARAVLERVTDPGLEATLVDAGTWADRVRADLDQADAVRVAMGRTLDELNRLRVNLRLGRPLDRPIH